MNCRIDRELRGGSVPEQHAILRSASRRDKRLHVGEDGAQPRRIRLRLVALADYLQATGCRCAGMVGSLCTIAIVNAGCEQYPFSWAEFELPYSNCQ